MKTRTINLLKRLCYVFVFFPFSMVVLLLGIVLAVPYWIITGESIGDSKANNMMQSFNDYLEND